MIIIIIVKIIIYFLKVEYYLNTNIFQIWPSITRNKDNKKAYTIIYTKVQRLCEDACMYVYVRIKPLDVQRAITNCLCIHTGTWQI